MFDIRVVGLNDVSLRLKQTQEKFTDYRSFFENTVVPAIFARFDEIFEAQGGVEGFARWAPLAARTLAEKRRKGHRLEILRATDRLYTSYTQRGSDNRIVVTAASLSFTSLVDYGRFHEAGSGVPKRQVVARILQYKAFQQDILQGLEAYIDDTA